MTFVIKTRGDGGMLVAEYRCDGHGLFESVVQRDSHGDPPQTEPCPECNVAAPWTISAPKPRNLTVLPTAAVRGGDVERRPGMLDTRPLAEGMPRKEWKKLQDKAREERRHHQLIKKGFKQKRIQVG